jgi:beta-xylosidase
MVEGAPEGSLRARLLLGVAALCAVTLLAPAPPAGANAIRVPAARTAATTVPYAIAPAPYPLDQSWYQNPVATGESADPFGFPFTGAVYYLYSTGDLFPIRTSTDMVHWAAAGTAMLRRPSWVVPQGEWHAWSPNVIHTWATCPAVTLRYVQTHHLAPSSSCYYMYYVGWSRRFSVNCVAVATATNPAGPFVDHGPLGSGRRDAAGRPVGCGDDFGYGNIDPAPFMDSDGRAYLYVSTDFVCSTRAQRPGRRSRRAGCPLGRGRLRPTISAMPLAPDLLHVAGARVGLFAGTSAWQRTPRGHVVEGPWLEKRGSVYHLFYSAGWWKRLYAMGDAILATPLGPVTQDPHNPILAGGGNVDSPGGGSTVTGPHGGEWMLYHARIGGFNAPRELFIDRIVWNPDGTVSISGPTSTPQTPAP